MNIQKMDEYLLSKKGVVLEYNTNFTIFRYLIGGRCFAMEMLNSKNHPILLLKLDPRLTDNIKFLYPEMNQGYYLRKINWNSIDCLDSLMSDEVIVSWIDMSYSMVYKTLNKEERRSVEIGE